MTQVKLCGTSAVPEGELEQFGVGETEVLVVNLGGQFFCLAARCTHAGAPLGEGTLIGDMLVCPWHGSRFRVSDGAVLKGPAEKPVRVFPNIVKDGYLFIEL